MATNFNLFYTLKRILRYPWFIRYGKPDHIEFLLGEYCNLNCKGCAHFAPLAPKEFVEIKSLISQINEMGKICGDRMKKIMLMGGETLLYPHLTEAMDALRRAFPNVQLYIVTNGLLLPRMDEAFWDNVRKNCIIVSVTRYPVNFDYDKIEVLCKEKDVHYHLFGDRSGKDGFFRFRLDPAGGHNRYLAHYRCQTTGCIGVYDGYIYTCPVTACLKHINNSGKYHFNLSEGDRIAIKDLKSYKQILKMYRRPVPFCSYCAKPQVVPFAISEQKLSEWIDEE